MHQGEKDETKPRTMNNVNPIPDPVMALAQKFDQMTTEILNSQANIMDRLTILEKERSQNQNPPPRPQFNNNQKPREKPRME
jgi:hypothetical protein